MSKQLDWEKRERAAGKVPVRVWVYKEDRDAVVNYARKKRAARERQAGKVNGG